MIENEISQAAIEFFAGLSQYVPEVTAIEEVVATENVAAQSATVGMKLKALAVGFVPSFLVTAASLLGTAAVLGVVDGIRARRNRGE